MERLMQHLTNKNIIASLIILTICSYYCKTTQKGPEIEPLPYYYSKYINGRYVIFHMIECEDIKLPLINALRYILKSPKIEVDNISDNVFNINWMKRSPKIR